MSDISVGITGTSELEGVLDAIAGRIGNPGPVADGVYAAFLDIERRRFDAEGPGWAQLADSTLATKARRGQPETILEATGKLRDSLTDYGAAGALFVPLFGDGSTAITMGTDLKPDKPGRGYEDVALAAFHQQGTTGPGNRTMPARPVIDDDTDMAVAWTAILTEWLSYGTVSVLL